MTIRPPAHLHVIVEALGQDMAVDFLLEFGGAHLNISANPNARNPVRKAFGNDAAQRLAEVSDRLPREIPLGKKWLAQVLYSKGLSKAAIARKLHVSQPTVRAYLNGSHDRNNLKRDPNQLSLF